MGLLATYDHYEPNSTPKLTLSKLPCKPREPIQMLTPPLHPSFAIPFHWEEAPGKPRANMDEAPPPPPFSVDPLPNKKVARCLDLPPRLLNDDAKITIMTSPMTMLDDGPYVGRSLSLACTFSFRKGPVVCGEDGLRPKKKSSEKFGSRRCGSFREEKFEGKGTFDFSSALDDFFENEKSVKITRFRRKKSFFCLSSINSNLLADMYASFKQAVPWKRK